MHILFTSAMYSTAAYTATNVDDFSLPYLPQPNFTGLVSMQGLSGLVDLRWTSWEIIAQDLSQLTPSWIMFENMPIMHDSLP